MDRSGGSAASDGEFNCPARVIHRGVRQDWRYGIWHRVPNNRNKSRPRCQREMIDVAHDLSVAALG